MGLPHEEVAAAGVAVEMGRGGGGPHPQYYRPEENSSRRGGSGGGHERGSAIPVAVNKGVDLGGVQQKGFIEFCDCGSRSGSASLSPPVQLYGSARSNDLDGREKGVWEYGYSPAVGGGVVAGGRGSRPGHGEKHPLKALHSAGSPPSIIRGFVSPQPCSSPKSKPSVSREAAEFASLQPDGGSSVASPRGDYCGIPTRKTTSSPLASMLSSGQNASILEFNPEEEESDFKSRFVLDDDGDNAGRCNFGSSARFMLDDDGDNAGRRNFGSSSANCLREAFSLFERGKFPVSVDGSNPVPIPGAIDRSRGGVLGEETDGPVLVPRAALSSREVHHSSISSAFAGSNPGKLGEQWRAGSTDCTSRWSPSPRSGMSSFLSLSPLGPRWPISAKGNEHGHGRFWESNLEAVSPPRLRLLNFTAVDVDRARNMTAEYDINGHTSGSLFDESGFGCKYISPATPRKWSGVKWGSEATSAPSTVGMKSPGASAGQPIRRSLVGSFEESLLSGRFLAGKPCQRLDGFLASLIVTGGGWSAPSRKLPFSVTCVDGDSSLLYYASIDLAGTSVGSMPNHSKTLSQDGPRGHRSRVRIPVQGRVQLVLSNPEKTPVHTFICSYDLSDMPPGTKTFVRHKVSLAASGPAFPRNDKLSTAGSPKFYSKPSDSRRSCPRCSCPSVNGNSNSILKKDGTQLYSLLDEKERGVKLRNVGSGERGRTVKSPQSKFRSPSGLCTHKPPLVVDEMYRNQGDEILEDGSPFDSNTDEGIVKLKAPLPQGIKPTPLSKADVPPEREKPLASAKSLDSTGSVLRYALHLRFMCPPLRTSARERNAVGMTGEQPPAEACKVPPSGGNRSSEMKGDRRFYIYGDLRVVFPQRQSDSDEGKLQVEYDFPANPKYFEYSC